MSIGYRSIGGRRARGRGRKPRDAGQSLIELVLVLPLLLLLLFGILEFANAWRTYQVVTNSGREGCRHAVIPGSTDASVEAVIDSRLAAGGLDPAAKGYLLTRCELGGGVTSCVGQDVIVDLTYPFQFRMVGPIAELICGNCGTNFGSVTLSTQTIMRSEY